MRVVGIRQSIFFDSGEQANSLLIEGEDGVMAVPVDADSVKSILTSFFQGGGSLVEAPGGFSEEEPTTLERVAGPAVENDDEEWDVPTDFTFEQGDEI